MIKPDKTYLFYLILIILTIGCKDHSTESPDIFDQTIAASKDSIQRDSISTQGLLYIFDIDAVPEIKLSITTAEWNKLLSYFDQNPDNEEYIKADFDFTKNNQLISLSNIGLRLRGNTSRRRPEGKTNETHNGLAPTWHHASFALSFKKFVKDQKFYNAEKLNLKWFKDDATYTREVYCYDLFERYGVWTAPQSSYCRLSIKIKEDNSTAYFGVYQLVEPIDKEYVKNRPGKYPDSNGNLWKANYGADFKSADKSLMGIEVVSLNPAQSYTPVYDLKTNDTQLEAAKTQLADFISNLNSKTGDDFKNWISSKMDVSLFLKTYAVNVICGMWDDYWNNKNNFYFYFDSAGKFYFIPYDYDNTLGTSYLMTDSGKQDLLNWGNPSHPLVIKILSIPEFRSMYINNLNELCSSNKDYFYFARSIERITYWQNKIRTFINNDTHEDAVLADRPAYWGNCPNYSLLTTTNSYFVIRAANLPH